MELMTIIKIAVVCSTVFSGEKPSDSETSFCLVNYEVAETSLPLHQCTRKYKDQLDARFVADAFTDVRRAYCMYPGKAKAQLVAEREEVEAEGYSKVAVMTGEI